MKISGRREDKKTTAIIGRIRKDVGAYCAVSDADKEIGTWDSRLRVTSRGYMLGYNDLKDPSVSGFFRFLARIGDKGMKMQIVKIGFGGRQ